MRSKFKWIFTLLIAMTMQFSFAQEKTITGVVTDGTNPIPGANIIVKGNTKGVTTGFDGKYSIKAKVGDVLVYTFMGMRDIVKTVGESAVINTVLQDNSKQLGEVVIVAFGKQNKQTVVGSNTQIKAEQFKQRSITNVAQALDGAAPGIQVTSGSGQPGSPPSVRIRGFSSVNFNSNPLYVVDGVPYLANTLDAAGTPIQGSALAGLNPDDIDTINVLKDAASTALYGSSAANGVVLITTKKGKIGKTTVNFNFSTGISERSVPQYERIDAKDYYSINWESIRNGRLTLGDTPTAANTFANNNLITVLRSNVYNVPDNQLVVNGVFNPNASMKYSDLDWDKEIAKTGIRQNADLSFSGATEKTSYYASLSYLKDIGYVINSDFDRLNGRLNIESNLKDWLKVGLNTSISNTFSNNAIDANDNATSFVNPFFFTRGIGPIYSPYLHNADGTNVLNENGEKVYDLFQARGAGGSAGRHAIFENLANSNLSKTLSTNNRFTVDFKLTPELTFTSVNGYDTRSLLNRTYTNNILGDAIGSGSASRTINLNQISNFQQLLNYKKKVKDHSIEALIGHESLNSILEFITTSKRLQTVAGNDDLANFATTTGSNSYTETYRKEGYFSRLNYDYNQKYVLTASVRRDGSSKFASDYRWDWFWSTGARWNISNEKFFENIKLIDQLSLRGSYGIVGNDNGISNFAYQSTFNLGSNNALEPGYVIGRNADETIQWEGNTQLDLGLDFSLANKRISGSVEVYKRESRDLLFRVPTILSSGNAFITQNIGNMSNKGLELSLKLTPIKTSKFGFDIVLNASRNLNELTKLPEGQTEIISGTKKLMVGKSIYDYWLRQWWGVDPSDGTGLFLLADNLIGTTAADIRVVNGQYLTSNFNKAKFDYSGSAIPNWFGSVGLNFNYKRLSLNTLFSYQMGGKVYDTNYSRIMSGYPEGLALHKDILTRWQNPGDITDVPAVNSQNAVNIAAASTRWLRDADFLVFRTATLNYTFNPDVAQKLNLSGLKLYVSGENLFTFTSVKGMEAQENFNGTTLNRYSPARVVSLGINVAF